MQMTPDEIRTHFKWLNPSQNRLTILAELNDCEKEDIKKILLSGNSTSPKKRLSDCEDSRYRSWSKEELEALVKMRKQNLPYDLIAERLNRTKPSCWQALKRLKKEGVIT